MASLTILLLSPLLTLLQQHQPTCSSNTPSVPVPQGLCTGYPSSQTAAWLAFLTSCGSLHKRPLLSEAFPDQPMQNNSSQPPYLLYFCPEDVITTWHTYYTLTSLPVNRLLPHSRLYGGDMPVHSLLYTLCPTQCWAQEETNLLSE